MGQSSAVRFDFNLASDAPGWADPVVEVNGAVVRMTVGWSSDALGDLLNSLIELLNGGGAARCAWEQEPGRWIWEFLRLNVTDVRLRLIFHRDAYGSLPSDFDPETQTEAVLPLARLIEAFSSGARRCLDPAGPEGYMQQWREHPFPVLQLQMLETWAGTGATAPLYEPGGE